MEGIHYDGYHITWRHLLLLLFILHNGHHYAEFLYRTHNHLMCYGLNNTQHSYVGMNEKSLSTFS